MFHRCTPAHRVSGRFNKGPFIFVHFYNSDRGMVRISGFFDTNLITSLRKLSPDRVSCLARFLFLCTLLRSLCFLKKILPREFDNVLEIWDNFPHAPWILPISEFKFLHLPKYALRLRALEQVAKNLKSFRKRLLPTMIGFLIRPIC